MKKILIGVIILILLILGYFMCFKGIALGRFKISSISDIKKDSNKLDKKLDEANRISAQTYPKGISNLESAEKKLNSSKKEYESKISYNTANQDIFTTYLKSYKIETLMVNLGRHSKQNSLKDFRFDLKTTNKSNVYDLDFTIAGSYESIYNFIYSIENDTDLSFEIVDLSIEPYMIKKTTTITNIDTNKSTTVTEQPHSKKETVTSESVVSSKEKNNATGNATTNATSNANKLTTTNKESTTKSNTNQTKTDVVYDPKNVQAEFTIKDVTITFN